MSSVLDRILAADNDRQTNYLDHDLDIEVEITEAFFKTSTSPANRGLEMFIASMTVTKVHHSNPDAGRPVLDAGDPVSFIRILYPGTRGDFSARDIKSFIATCAGVQPSDITAELLADATESPDVLAGVTLRVRTRSRVGKNDGKTYWNPVFSRL